MDKYSTPRNSLSDSESVVNKFKILTLMDPRSPTTAFQRTPLQVIFKNSRRIFKDDSVISTPAIEIEPSPMSVISTSSILSDDEESLNLSSHDSCSFANLNSYEDNYEMVQLLTTQSISINDEEIALDIVAGITNSQNTISDVCPVTEIPLKSDESGIQYDASEILTPPTENLQSSCVKINNRLNNITPISDSIENEVTNKRLSKQHFLTPNKRTPLGAVENLCATTPTPLMLDSPQNMFKEKQWKRIQVERKKLGFEVDENVQLPLYDITASAPSNLTRKSRIQEKFNVHIGKLDF